MGLPMNNAVRHSCDASTRRLRSARVICVHLYSSVVAMLWLAGCAVGPDYKKPEISTPEKFKEAGDWVVAKPSDSVPKGKWWEAFRDPVLNRSEEHTSELQSQFHLV